MEKSNNIMKVIGKMIKCKDLVFIIMLKDLYIVVNGKIINIMEKAGSNWLMVHIMKELGEII